jgi:hypothetical protein
MAEELRGRRDVKSSESNIDQTVRRSASYPTFS